MGALIKEGSQLRVRQRRVAAAGFYTKREKVLRGILPSCGSLECSAPRKDIALKGERVPMERKISKIPNPTNLLHPPSLSSSVDSVLFSREVDPAELLMDLGFGGASTDRLARIPLRFFQPSKVSSALYRPIFWDIVASTPPRHST